MSKIISFLTGVKLTLAEWLAIVGSLVIGGLVVALRIQGSKLHKAQLQLLSLNIKVKVDKADAAVTNARGAYLNAKDAFLKGGGTIILLFALAIGTPARSDQGQPDLLPRCQSALSACDNLVNVQDDEIKVLKHSLQDMEKIAEKNLSRGDGFLGLPGWVWGVVGFSAGVAIGVGIRK